MDEYTGDQTPELIWLNYSLAPKVTPALRRQLRQLYPDPARLRAFLSDPTSTVQTGQAPFDQDATLAIRSMRSVEVITRVQDAHRWQALSPSHHIVGQDHPAYPSPLLSTSNAPPVLYVNGDLNCLNSPCVAIVGARKASHAALEQTVHIASELASSGVTIVSGLALGVDAAAHQGAMNGAGQTIAVSATGPERTYPRAHGKLAEEIQANGAVITEFALHNTLQTHCFPRRNRIISGMSVGVLVVEAALPSGTLTTAQHALRQGREVMAMPGSIHNPLTRGCHDLIKSGAALVENTDDILACLRADLERHLIDRKKPESRQTPHLGTKKLTNVSPDALTLLDCLGYDPVSVDTLVRRSGLDTAQVCGTLTHLEISGLIAVDHSGRYTRCKTSQK